MDRLSPYIKPTRFIHDSGYRCFEVGYILEMENHKVTKKRVLGNYSDHIYTSYRSLLDKDQYFDLNMDLTRDGYIRFFSHKYNIGWETEYAYSSMSLEIKGLLKEIN